MGPLLKDASWVRQAFLVKAEDFEQKDRDTRFFSSAQLKYTDTTPGGNFAINPPYQFCENTDIPIKGRFSDSDGMGPYYSEAIDDNAQLIHLRFGVAQFNSLTTFFTGFYNGSAGRLARTGRAEVGMFYWLGRAATFVATTLNFYAFSLQMLGYAGRFFLDKPSSKFYYLKPTMPLYWNTVATIINQIAVNMGVVPRVGGIPSTSGLGDNYEFDADALKKLHLLLPDIFKDGGGIDVYAMANRAQRLAHRNIKQLQQALESATSNEDLHARFKAINNSNLQVQRPDYHAYLERYLTSSPGTPQPGTVAQSDAAGGGNIFTSDSSLESPPDPFAYDNAADQAKAMAEKQAWYSKFPEFMSAELDDGAAFATFRVDSTGQVSSSFSNSAEESEISQKINGLASSQRNTNFNFANGNIVGGALGAVAGKIMGGIKDFVSGVTDQLKISGLAALGGAAFVDIPKHWYASSASLPRANYSMKLISPYGNPISRLIDIYIPLAMLLAGSLPISTGKQSWTSPFLCELYDQGRCQTRLGMIDGLSLSMGTSNLGFNNEGKCLAIDVTFSVIDMSSVLHMPINQNFSIPGGVVAAGAVAGGVMGAAAGGVGGAIVGAGVGTVAGTGVASAAAMAHDILNIFDDETVFSDFMSLLAGMSLSDQIYPSRKIKLRLTRMMENWDSFYSASHFASFVGDTIPGRLVSMFYKGTNR